MPDEGTLDQALAAVYRGKRILVTGHTGFKGGWLCLLLRKLGAEVAGIALHRPPQGPDFFHSVDLGELVDHRIADIRDARAYGEACKGLEPDLVFHLAAQALVRPSYADPVETFATNVTGTAIVLDAVRRMPSARGVVVVTSDKCYDNREWAWPYRETDALGGADPYSASKGCTELVAAAFRHSYFTDPAGCQIATARAGNVIGGGDMSLDRLLPDVVRATMAGTTVTIRNPASVRPWQHVLEPVTGYLMLGARLLGSDALHYAEAFNFGPSADGFIDVETLARRFQHAWGPGVAQIAFGKRPDDPHEAGMLTLDSSKARARLGWRPRLSTEDAVALTAEWYRTATRGHAAMRAFSEAQIAHYFNATADTQSFEGATAACA
ncbi:CDP-glucose 4,6-dehydratase [Novosphingobium sp. PhB165]|uniref:CDP-glucose 4,6-dehydratase n=1 Tax=Novosphingobium sp. PhB165 TaxID=2485105 RepID=UPI0010489BE2|nr:CDP-glucose 4,6-dehydratase [Novosphingobium sp. PhB165]TCM21357.1 CDP-glucose 4,6-dehydratase [Novosphingobium sp. PhB165]